MTFVSWRGGSFLVGKILINLRILRDLFLISVPLIRVNRKVQDISLYKYIYTYIYIYIYIRGGQARPRWTRRLLHSRRLHRPLASSEDLLSASRRCFVWYHGAVSHMAPLLWISVCLYEADGSGGTIDLSYVLGLESYDESILIR